MTGVDGSEHVAALGAERAGGGVLAQVVEELRLSVRRVVAVCLEPGQDALARA